MSEMGWITFEQAAAALNTNEAAVDWLVSRKEIAVRGGLDRAVAEGWSIRERVLPTDRVLDIAPVPYKILPEAVVSANDGRVSERAVVALARAGLLQHANFGPHDSRPRFRHPLPQITDELAAEGERVADEFDYADANPPAPPNPVFAQFAAAVGAPLDIVEAFVEEVRSAGDTDGPLSPVAARDTGADVAALSRSRRRPSRKVEEDK